MSCLGSEPWYKLGFDRDSLRLGFGDTQRVEVNALSLEGQLHKFECVCPRHTAKLTWSRLTFHFRKFVISSGHNGYFIRVSSSCSYSDCTLAVISLITVLRHSSSCQKSKDERQMIFVPIKTLVWFPPMSLPFQTAKWNAKTWSLWTAIQRPCWRSGRTACLCIVVRYRLDPTDRACGFPAW